MRKLITLLFLGALSVALAGAARGADPDVGTLSIEHGKGHFTLDVRGAVVLGRLTNGSVTVTDRSPSDPYVATVTGRRVAAQRRLGPAKVFVRGQGLRFRMLGGNYRIVINGAGLALSVVGRGMIQLDGDPRVAGEDVGVYSLEGVDCSVEPQNCEPVPVDPVRLKLEQAPQAESRAPGAGNR